MWGFFSIHATRYASYPSQPASDITLNTLPRPCAHTWNRTIRGQKNLPPSPRLAHSILTPRPPSRGPSPLPGMRRHLRCAETLPNTARRHTKPRPNPGASGERLSCPQNQRLEKGRAKGGRRRRGRAERCSEIPEQNAKGRMIPGVGTAW